MGEGTSKMSQRRTHEQLGKKLMVAREGETKNNGSNMRQCIEEGSNKDWGEG